jgi:hypothetical protein
VLRERSKSHPSKSRDPSAYPGRKALQGDWIRVSSRLLGTPKINVIEIKLTLADCILEVHESAIIHTKTVTSEDAVRAYLAGKGADAHLIETVLTRLQTVRYDDGVYLIL